MRLENKLNHKHLLIRTTTGKEDGKTRQQQLDAAEQAIAIRNKKLNSHYKLKTSQDADKQSNEQSKVRYTS